MRDQDETQVGDQTRSARGWRTGDAVSRLLIDIAAGRPFDPDASLSEEALLLAHNHGLMGLMATGPPGSVKQAAHPSFSRLKARQEVMVSHLRRVLESFAAAGIRATVLKGPDLAARTYRTPDHRTFTDIDVLVQPNDLTKALELLAQDPGVSSIPAQGPKADKRNIFMADPGGVRFTLDLHWDLFSYTQLQGAARGATETAWRAAILSNNSDQGPIWQLPDEAIVCFLCTHALLDHRFRLILFRDLTEVSLRLPDWEEVGRFAMRWGLRASTYVSLLMGVRLTDTQVPAHVLDDLRPRSVAIRVTKELLPRTDLVRFDGHKLHPLNLAIVLLHDTVAGRVRLAARAPAAFPNWRRRVGTVGSKEGATSFRSTSRSLVILVTTDRRRGAEVFGERLAQALQQRGWDVSFLSLSSDQKGPRVHARTVSNLTPDQLGRLNVRVVWKLRTILAQKQAHIVLANGSATLQYALAASRTLRPRPRVLYSSIGEPLYWIGSAVRRLLQRLLLSQADLVLAVSESTKEQLIDGVGLSEQSVIVAATGVPDVFFDVDAGRPDRHDLRVLFLGNLSREKNPMAAVELAHRLSRIMAVELRFVGEGPLQETLEARAVDLGLRPAVVFAGSVEDVGPQLAWADLLILTSETEGLPGVVLEAAAAGVPAVAFDVGGVAETILPGLTGELVPARDFEALYAAVLKLATNRSRLAEMGKRARTFVAERYGLDRSVDLYEQILNRELLKERDRPKRSMLGLAKVLRRFGSMRLAGGVRPHKPRAPKAEKGENERRYDDDDGEGQAQARNREPKGH